MKSKVESIQGKEIVSEASSIGFFMSFNQLKKSVVQRWIVTLNLCMATILLLPAAGHSQDAESENIKKVIRAETESYYKADGPAWQATWAQEGENTRTIISSGSYSGMAGWESYGPATLDELKKAKPVPTTFKNDNYKIRREGNLALVEYDQVLFDIAEDSTHKHISREFRTLKKDQGVWKIVSQITVDTESFKITPAYIAYNFNTIGYKFLEEKKFNEAIDVFALNVKLNPEEWNVYDSLGEAYALAGQKELAVKNYEKSLALNPKNENGITALAKLKQK